MENLGRILWKRYTSQAQLWAGWEHARTPIGFHDHNQAVLYGHPNPGPQFTEKEGEGVKYHVANPKPLSFTANSSVLLNGIPTATIMWHEREEETMLGLISHEAFHAHQMAANCPLGNIAMAMCYPVNDPEIQALAETEATLLSQALRSKSLNLVVAALDARKARQALLPRDIADFENEVELGEGLATYIEITSAGPGSSLWQAKVNKLTEINKNAWGADRLRFYYSGMAWALLCDQLTEDWQNRGWHTLADIVAEAILHSPEPARRQFPGLEYNGILSRHRQEARERERRIEETMAQAFPGTGLRVEVHTKGNPVGGGWNPITAMTFPGRGRFHSTGLMYLFDSGSKFEVQRDCMEKVMCRHMVFERRNLTVLLDGRKLNPGQARGPLEISGIDSKVSFPMAEVYFKGNCLRVEEII